MNIVQKGLEFVKVRKKLWKSKASEKEGTLMSWKMTSNLDWQF